MVFSYRWSITAFTKSSPIVISSIIPRSLQDSLKLPFLLPDGGSSKVFSYDRASLYTKCLISIFRSFEKLWIVLIVSSALSDSAVIRSLIKCSASDNPITS